MLIQEHFHLSYCTNIHPGKNWQLTFEKLQQHLPEIKRQLSPNSNFGLGLRLSNLASEELGLDQNLIAFKKWLDDHDIYVFTMNGFPFGNFHAEPVKDQVHAPDWTTQERIEYTERLFRQLAFLLPDGISGGISTSPVSYKHWHKSAADQQKALSTGAQHMVQIALMLHEIEEETGKYLHLDIEPEPDGLLENTEDVIAFFENHLVTAAKLACKEKGIAANAAEQLLKRYITLCYDVCHFSLAFEAPETTFPALQQHQIKIGKIQVSAALKIVWNAQFEAEIWQVLQEFNEPVYLHQVTQQDNGQVVTYSDLPEVLDQRAQFQEMRAHFHVPIFLKRYGKLHSTQDDILKVIDYLKAYPITTHLEVETYTWDVLPEQLKLDLNESIIRELQWLKEQLA